MTAGALPGIARGGVLRGDVVALVTEQGLFVGAPGDPWRRVAGRWEQVAAGPDGFVAVGDATAVIDERGRVRSRRAADGPLAVAGGRAWQASGGVAAPVDGGAAPVPLVRGRLLGGAGRSLFVGTVDHLERIDVDTGAREVVAVGAFHAFAGAPDGRWLASGATAWSSTAGPVPLGVPAVGDGFLAVGGLVLRDDGTALRWLGHGFVLADGPRAVFVGRGGLREFAPLRPADGRGPRSEVHALATGDGFVAASDREGVTLYRADGALDRRVPFGADRIDPPAVALSGGGLWVGTAPVQRIDLTTGRRTVAVPTTLHVGPVVGLPDGGALVADHDRVRALGPDGGARWTVGPFPRPDGGSARIRALARDPDDGTLAIALDDVPTRVGTPPDGPWREAPRAHAVVALGAGSFALADGYDSVVVHEDGTVAPREPFEQAVVGPAGPVFVHHHTASLPAGPGRFAEAWRCLAADAAHLYTASPGGGVAVRDPASGARRGLLRSDTCGKVVSLALSGRWLAVAEWRRVHLWDLGPRVPRWVRTLDLRPSREHEPPGLPEEGVFDIGSVSLDGGLHVACGVGLSWSDPEALGVEPPWVVAAGAAGSLVAVAAGGSAWLVDGHAPKIVGTDGEVRLAPDTDWDRDHGEHLSADGARLLIQRGRRLRVVGVDGEVGTLDASAGLSWARFAPDGSVWGLLSNRRLAFRWVPHEDGVTEAFPWPAGVLPAQRLLLAGPHMLLDTFAGLARLGPDGVVRLPTPEDRTALAVGVDGTVAVGGWSGRVVVSGPDGAERAELLVALDGRWRVRAGDEIVAESP